MKKILLCGIVMLMVTFFVSCQQESENSSPFSGNGFNLELSVNNVETGVVTRAVDPEPGETTVNSLYLLFFEYSADGTGKFIESMEIPNPVMNGNNPIQFTGTNLDNTTNYSLLAFANIAVTGNKYLPEDSSNMEEFLQSFDDLTENEAKSHTLLFLTSAGTNESDNSHAIKASELVMSASAIKQGGVSSLALSLDRGVARFDMNLSSVINTDYSITSVSIWNGAVTTPLWFDRADTPEITPRLYGVEYAGGVGSIKGGLYSFENFVSDPKQGDDKTTCVIVGLTPLTSTAHGTVGTPMYYRININPPGSSQNLKRNFVYNISLSGVREAGFNSEGEAYVGEENRLSYEINNWNIDSNGVILTDGTHILGLPFRTVTLNPDGETVQESVFTSGPSTARLEITKSALVSGLTVGLVGNTLTINATPLPAGETERRGSIELTYGSLRGTIDIVQSKNQEQFLDLNKSTIPTSPSIGPAEISGGRVVVTSSGPWKARIHNNAVGSNPGFSFRANGDEVNELTYETNNNSNEIAVYTTGTNPSNVDRYSFIVISLASNENITRVLVLRQRGTQAIVVYPDWESMNFTINGAPVGMPNAQPSNPFEFDVNPGSDEDGNVNPWTAVLSGTDAAFFDLRITHGISEKVEVWAKGRNDSGSPYTAAIKIYVEGAETTLFKEMRIVQDGAPLEITTSSSNTTVPATGATSARGFVQFKVSLEGATGVTYSAAIVDGSDSDASHKAYFVDDSNSKSRTLPTTALNTPFRIGFDKIYFPNVGKRYTATVRVTSSTGATQDVQISQDALVRKGVEILDFVASRDPFGTLAGSGTNHYFGNYRTQLLNGTNFGPSGVIPANSAIRVNNTVNASNSVGTIGSAYNYLHAGSNKIRWNSNGTAYSAINNWRANNEGIIVYVQDRYQANVYSGMGLSMASRNSNSSSLASVGTNRVMRFLCQNGPFGTVNSVSLLTSGENVAVNANGTAVPVINASNGGALLTIDPVNKFVYIGECQFFDTGGGTFLTNLQAFIILSAQYGSHFLDIFSDNTVDYPFDAPGFTYPRD